MPRRPDGRARSRSTPPGQSRCADRCAPRLAPDDRFFRQLVGSMRNGVIAIHRDGTLALMNDEAYRIFSLTRSAGDVGRPFSEVFRERPDLIRVLSGAFELTTLPNRAELRLKDVDRVIGYTLSQVKDEHGGAIGAVLFFKDLTQVEQLEERERLRDRLASLGEMAAGIAHELKNPLAGIEVMAGLLRRQVPDSPDAQSLLADIISEAKLANAIVVEMLEFVRPIRLQVERTDIARRAAAGDHAGRRPGSTRRHHGAPNVQPDLPMIDGDHHQLCQVFTNLLINAFEALDGRGRIDDHARAEIVGAGSGLRRRPADRHAGGRRRRHRRWARSAGGIERSRFSCPSSRPNRRARVSDCRSSGRSSMLTRDGSTSAAAPDAGTRFRVTPPGVDRIKLVQIERHALVWVEYSSRTITTRCGAD